MSYQLRCVFLLFTAISSISCKTRIAQDSDQDLVHYSDTNRVEGLQLVDQDVLKRIFANSESPVFKNKNEKYTFKNLGNGITIRIYEPDTYVITTGNSKYGTLKFYLFDKDIDPSAVAKAEKSYANREILEKLKQISPEIQFDEMNSEKMGILFQELSDEIFMELEHGVFYIQRDRLDIELPSADIELLLDSQEFKKTLPDHLMQKVNKLNQLVAFHPDLFVRVLGHGDIGSDFVQTEMRTNRPLKTYPDLLAFILSNENRDSIKSVHVEIDACNAGVCHLGADDSMVGRILTDFGARFPQVQSLTGNGSTLSVNSDDPSRKIVWALTYFGNEYKIRKVNMGSVFGAHVNAKKVGGNIEYSIIDLEESKLTSDPLVLEMINIRADLARQLENASATGEEIARAMDGSSDNPTLKKFAQYLNLENALVLYQNKKIDSLSFENMIKELRAGGLVQHIPNTPRPVQHSTVGHLEHALRRFGCGGIGCSHFFEVIYDFKFQFNRNFFVK